MKTTRKDSGAASGFTLIEILLAVAIFAVVLAAINSVFFSALRLRNKTVELLDQSLPLHQAVQVIRNDLANLVPPNGLLSGELQSRVSGIAAAGQISPDFHTATGVLSPGLPWGDVQRVAYLLVDSTDGSNGKDLIRTVTRNLLASVGEDWEEERRLLGNIEQVDFLYFDGTQWRDSWDSSTEAPRLPQAIKVEIRFVTENSTLSSAAAPVEIIVPVTVQPRENGAAQEGGAAS